MTFFVDTIDKRNTYVKNILSKNFEVKSIERILECKKNDAIVFAPNKKFTDEELKHFPDNIILFCGNIPKQQQLILVSKNIIHKNLLSDEVFAIQNSNLTAEGILQNILTHSEKSIFENKILILGNGRVGKATARLFDKLGIKHFTITSSDKNNFALSFLFCDDNIFGKEVLDKIENFDVIINTIPAKFLPTKAIKKIQDEALFLEIASIESIDKGLAKHFKYILCPALPQKFSAYTAGKIMAESVLRMLK